MHSYPAGTHVPLKCHDFPSCSHGQSIRSPVTFIVSAIYRWIMQVITQSELIRRNEELFQERGYRCSHFGFWWWSTSFLMQSKVALPDRRIIIKDVSAIFTPIFSLSLCNVSMTGHCLSDKIIYFYTKYMNVYICVWKERERDNEGKHDILVSFQQPAR